MGRAPCCEKIGLKKGRWTIEEDEILTKYIQANGEGSWRSLPKNAGLLRCGKSCRLRWINYLRADLKRGNISSVEEDIIIKLHASLGNKWSLIASHLPGRTDNEIKNYWNSHLSRKIDTYRRHISNESTPMAMDLAKVNTNPPKPKGKTSRWAMKKNKSSSTQKSTSVSTKEPKEGVPLPTTPTITEKETINIKEHMSNLDHLKSSPQNNLESFNCQNIANETSMFCPSLENGTTLLLGPNCNEEGDIYDGELSFNDIVLDDELLCTSGVLNSIEERQSIDVLNQYISEERDNGVDSWDWESVLEDGQEIWDEKMLSWLWENDHNWENKDGHKFEDVVDSEKQNAIVAWLLS